MGGEAVMTAFGAQNYFWGNMPAIDVVQLDANEGGEYDGDLHLLFAGMSTSRSTLCV